MCVYVHAHPYGWLICVHSVQMISPCPSLLPLLCVSCLTFTRLVCCTVCVFIFVLQTLSQRRVVNASWTVYKRDRVRLGKDGWNMCSVMCAVIDMLTSSFQAAASKPRLVALIGFSRVCGCIRQCNMRHSVVYGLWLKKMPKFLFFFAPFAWHISVGYSEGTTL